LQRLAQIAMNVTGLPITAMTTISAILPIIPKRFFCARDLA
jgi:hypothetical protein